MSEIQEIPDAPDWLEGESFEDYWSRVNEWHNNCLDIIKSDIIMRLEEVIADEKFTKKD